MALTETKTLRKRLPLLRLILGPSGLTDLTVEEEKAHQAARELMTQKERRSASPAADAAALSFALVAPLPDWSEMEVEDETDSDQATYIIQYSTNGGQSFLIGSRLTYCAPGTGQRRHECPS